MNGRNYDYSVTSASLAYDEYNDILYLVGNDSEGYLTIFNITDYDNPIMVVYQSNCEALYKDKISFSFERDIHPGDFVLLYRNGTTRGRKGYESVITSLGIIDEIKYNFNSKDEFFNYCQNRTVFTLEKLEQF